MGERFCEPLRSRVPAFLDFFFAFQRYGMKFFSLSPVLSRSCFPFLRS